MTVPVPLMLARRRGGLDPDRPALLLPRRYKPLPWAPMKFLKEAIEQTSRRLKFQEWILLALRCLAIILLALALARPGWKTAGHRRPRRGHRRRARLRHVLQHGRPGRRQDPPRPRQGGGTRPCSRRCRPTRRCRSIACSDRATLLGPRRALQPRPGAATHPDARGHLASRPTSSRDSTEAFAAAKSGTAPAKEIYVFTDMQKTGFERQQGAIKAKCEEIRTAGEPRLHPLRQPGAQGRQRRRRST